MHPNLRFCVVAFGCLIASVISATPHKATVEGNRIAVPTGLGFEPERIAPLASPWSLAFLPDGNFLVSEKHGGLRLAPCVA